VPLGEPGTAALGQRFEPHADGDGQGEGHDHQAADPPDTVGDPHAYPVSDETAPITAATLCAETPNRGPATQCDILTLRGALYVRIVSGSMNTSAMLKHVCTTY
jgi:hypothetical protein